ncbi:MAG: PAS domain S-box protein, partial [Leptolyngbyaceae bacterium]|nr:PAS domain S-box protein [Leptolyngbyaceae bacterium]
LGVSLTITFVISQLQESQKKIQKLNQQLLQDKAEQLGMALAAAQMGLWDWNIQTGEIRWSPEHEQLLGLAPGTFDGKYETFDARLHPDDRERLNQAVQQAIQTQNPYQHEFRVIWPDGSIHWIEGRGQAFYDAEGQPFRMTGTVMEIGERKQAELQLQQQFEQQRLIVEITQRIRRSLNLQDILQATVDEVRQYLQTDRVIIFQFDPGWSGRVVIESVGDNWTAILSTQIYDPCFAESYVQPYQQGLVTTKSDIYTAGIGPCHLELLANFQVRANLVVPILQEEELWGLLIAHHCLAPREWQSAEIDLLKQVASQVSIALQQSTLFEQVQTELKERKQAELALQRNEEKLRLLIKYAPASIAMFDLNMCYLMASQRWIEDYQLGAIESLLGQSHYEIFPDLPKHWRQVHKRCLGGAIERCEEDLYIREDGTQQWICWEIRPWYAADQIAGIVIFTEEITERKQTEIALQQLNAELEQRVTERTEELTTANDRLLILLREQQQAQKVLEEQAQLLEDLYNNAPCGYHSLDAEGTIVRMNDTELSWLGYTRDEVLNKKKLADFLTPDAQQLFYQNFPKLKQQGWINNLEFQMVTKDGSTRWFNLNTTALKDEAGNFLMSRSSVFGIDARKQAEAALQQQIRQEQLLWSITQSIRQSLDLDTILNAAVTEVRQLLQVDRVAVYRFNSDWNGDFIAESVDTGWVKLVEPDICKIWEDTYLQETQGGRFQNHEILAVPDIYKADLQPCHIELLEQFQAKAYAIAPIFSGKNLWGLLALYQNASPRHWQTWEIELLEQIASQLAIALQQSQLYEQLQTELHERQQAESILREAERRWQSLLNNVQLVVIGLDQGGNVNYANPFFFKLTGYTEAEVIGKNWFETCIPEAEHEQLPTVFSEVLHSNAHPYYQNLILTKSEETRLIAWNNTPLKDANGNIIGTISIGEDITERQKIERMKNEFIGIVSHELRTPLTSIRASLGLLKIGVYSQKPDRFNRMIEIAMIDSDRLVRLVDDILDLERLESGQIVLTKTPCNAADLIQQAVRSVQAIATQHNIHLVTHPLPVEIWVASDTIIQTLVNLLSNAIKFSPADSTITVSVQQQADSLLFQVRDQGRGIPADKLEMIFGRFQQVDVSDSRQKGGTGLGLAICHSIVQKHGGQIWAESILGAGSTFFFTLPLSLKEAP